MTTRNEPVDGWHLFDATRRALATVCDGLDVSAVEPETPLAALLFDSLQAVKFIATLEGALGVAELPFERWIAQHSERADALTVGSLVGWLESVAEIHPEAAGVHRGEPSRPRSGDE